MSDDANPAFGAESICRACGHRIRFVGKYWEHIENSPRHPATPSGLWRDPKRSVIGLPVTGGQIEVEDLVKWIEQRDAACAEYLVDALREYQRTGEDVDE